MSEEHLGRCRHEHVVQEEVGSITISGGEVLDTRQTLLVCLDCGKIVKGQREGDSDEELPF